MVGDTNEVLDAGFVIDEDRPGLDEVQGCIKGFQAAVAEDDLPGPVKGTELFFRLGDGCVVCPFIARRFWVDDVVIKHWKHLTHLAFLCVPFSDETVEVTLEFGVVVRLDPGDDGL